MKVSPVSKTSSDLLKESFLRIPRFQRPYDWGSDNLTDFWNDLVSRSVIDYFMGSLVLYRDGKESNVLYLVDGQQRMTTTVITLGALRDSLLKLEENDLAQGIQNYLQTKDVDNKDRFVLEHTPANKYFQNAVLLKAADADYPTGTHEDRNLAFARRFIGAQLRFHISHFPTKEKKVEAIKALRDKILALQYISIELDNEDDAYVIFETLNTRGKDLRVSDLVKNLFTRAIKAKVKGVDTAKEDWSGILHSFDSVKTPYDVDDFLLHYWLSKEAYVSKAKLFKAFKSATPQKDAKSRLADLKDAAAPYIAIAAPREAKWTKQETSIHSSLIAISTFRVAQAIPLVLAVMRLYRSGIIKIPQAATALRLIENFTFQFNAITQSRGGGGISAMYAKLAQTVTKCANGDKFAQLLKDMKAKFGERLPSEEEFDYPFAAKIYRSDFTRDRDLIRYMLGKIARVNGMNAAISTDELTIEHLSPQSTGARTWEPDDVGAIGNLLFVTGETNSKLDDKKFPEKAAIVAAEVPWAELSVKTAASWGKADIRARGYSLAEFGRETVWKL